MKREYKPIIAVLMILGALANAYVWYDIYRAEEKKVKK